MAQPENGWEATVVGERHFYIPGIAITLEVLSTIFFAFRLWSRFSQSGGKTGVDDGFLIAGWVFGTALTISIIISANVDGYDRHYFELATDRYSQAVLMGWICHILFVLSTSFTKISVLLLFERLIRPLQNHRLLWTIRAAIAFVSVFMIIFFVIPFAACQPSSALWLKVNPKYHEDYHCADITLSLPIAAGASALTDLAAVVIPLVVLWSLQRPLLQKAGLYAVFATGFLVVGAGIARTVFTSRLVLLERNDFTWYGSLVLVASLFEHHLSLICACAPALRPVLSREVVPRLKNMRSFVSESNWRHFEDSLRKGSPDINEAPPRVRSPSFDAVHNFGLTSPMSAPVFDGMASIVASAYESDPIRDEMHRERRLDVPNSPILTHPGRILRLSGFSRMSRSTTASKIRGKAAEVLGTTDLISNNSTSDDDSTPEFPAELDPALNPKFVACRGCGGYHEHGFSHTAPLPKRPSGTRGWWKMGPKTKKGKEVDRGRSEEREEQEEQDVQSINVYLDDDDDLRREDL